MEKRIAIFSIDGEEVKVLTSQDENFECTLVFYLSLYDDNGNEIDIVNEINNHTMREFDYQHDIIIEF